MTDDPLRVSERLSQLERQVHSAAALLARVCRIVGGGKPRNRFSRSLSLSETAALRTRMKAHGVDDESHDERGVRAKADV